VSHTPKRHIIPDIEAIEDRTASADDVIHMRIG
jgi:hypothetical protein